MQRHTFTLSALRNGPAYRSELVLDDPKAGYALLMRLGMIKPGDFGLDALRQLDAGEEVRVSAQAGAAQC